MANQAVKALMLKLVTGMTQPNRLKIIKNKNFNQLLGFSLLELLVTIVIIGIVLTFVMLAFGDFGNERKAYMVQQHLADLIKLARTRAIIESKTYGLDINKKQYEFYEFHHDPDSPYGKWRTLKDNTFRPIPWQGQATIKYDHPYSEQKPEIIISASGHITPFQLIMTTPNKDKIKLETKHNGQVKIDEILSNG
jgi:general secretion pathway protein H